MRKMVILQNIPQYKEAIEAIAPGWEIVFTDSKEAANKEIPGAEIVVGWSDAVKDQCLAEETSLKWVQHYFAGVDTMPLAEMQEKGMWLTNASGIHLRPVSETIFAHMLGLARHIPQAAIAQKEKRWESDVFTSGNFSEIHGKVIGILGAGRIGSHVAKIARAFSMRTLGLKRTTEPAPYFDALYTPDQLLEMIGKCDYVVNLLPLTDDTIKVLNKEAFDAMPEGAVFLNFGRGESVDTDALIDALSSGHLGGAGLDVFEVEPLPESSPLWHMPNVLITPHSAGVNPYYYDRLMEIFTENLESYIKDGKPSRNIINYDLAY